MPLSWFLTKDAQKICIHRIKIIPKKAIIYISGPQFFIL